MRRDVPLLCSVVESPWQCVAGEAAGTLRHIFREQDCNVLAPVGSARRH